MQNIEDRFGAVESRLARLERLAGITGREVGHLAQEEHILSTQQTQTIADLEAAEAQEQADSQAEEAEIATVEATEGAALAEIQDLEAKLAAQLGSQGITITPEQLAAAISAVQSKDAQEKADTAALQGTDQPLGAAKETAAA